MKHIQSLCSLVLCAVLSSFAQNAPNSSTNECFGLSTQPTDVRWLRLMMHSENRWIHNSVRSITVLSHVTLDPWQTSTTDTLFQRVLWKPFDPLTIGAQTFAGGALSSLFAVPLISTYQSGLSLWFFAAIGASAVASFTLPAVVWNTGEVMGGDGSYLWTLAGTLAGGGVALLPNGNPKEAIARTAIFAVVCGITTYHLFASPVYESNHPRSLKLQPVGNVVSARQAQVPAARSEYIQMVTVSVSF